MRILSSLWTSSFLLFRTLSLLLPVWALHESEAGVVDWQKTFIGVPRTDGSQVAPSFLRVKTQGDETTSLVIFAAETTFRAVNPLNGSVGDASRLCMFTYLTESGFLATDSMEAYFRAI